MADDGYQAGRAYVAVLPDFRGFHQKITESLKGEEVTFAEAGDQRCDSAARSFAASFYERARLARPVVKPDADTREADRKLNDAARDRKSTILVSVKSAADKASSLGGIGKWDLAALGGIALGPQALGLGAFAAGTGVAAGASLAGLGAFALVAKSEVTKVQTAQKALLTAQQQYATAQQQYASATTKAGRSSALAAEAKALAAEEKAVKGLSPAERQLGQDLDALTHSWSALGKAEAPVIATALAPWVSAATRGIGLLRPLVSDTGSAIGFLGQEADQAFKSPFWTVFSNSLGSAAEAGVYGFGDALGHVGDGLAHLFVDFEPDIEKLPGLIDGWSKSFDRWAQSYNKSGFESFMSKTFSKGNVSVLKGDLQAVGTILENVGKAGASFSPAALLGLSNILSILAKLSPSQIEAIAILYGATRVVGTAAKAVGAISTVVSGVKNVFGGAAATAEQTAAGTAAGEASGAADGTAFTTAFGATVTAALPEAFVLIGATMSAEGGIAGETAGAATGTGFVTGFLASDVAEFGATIEELVGGAALAAGIGGAAVGAAAGTGFALGFGFASVVVGRAVGKLKGWASGPNASAGQWLQGDGRAAALGFARGYLSGEGAVRSAAGRTPGWVTSGVNASSGGLRGTGQSIISRVLSGLEWEADVAVGALYDAGKTVIGGFLGGLESGWKPVQSFIGGIAGWISAHKGPISYDATLLTPHGEAVMGSFYDGLLRGYGPVQSLIGGIAPAIAGGASLPGVGRAGSAGALRLQLSWAGSNNELINALVTGLRADIQGNAGGDVQKRLGRGPVRK